MTVYTVTKVNNIESDATGNVPLQIIESSFDQKSAALTVSSNGSHNYADVGVYEDAFTYRSIQVRANGITDLSPDGTKEVVSIDVTNDFADDAAAADGNIAVGKFYHTAGVLKVRLT